MPAVFKLLPARLATCLLAVGLVVAAHAAAPSADWWPDVHNDRADAVRTALARGVDPNVRYQNGQPAIMRAVVDGAWNVFDVLAADPRTDLNAQNPAGETPLMYLALAGQTERAEALIARGAQVNRLGWTPLHYAASKGQLDAARLLLRHQAMPNAPSPQQGTTPLMMAAFSGSQPMVQLLLDAGADPLTRDLKGMSAADWAEAGKAGGLAQRLRELMAKVERRRDAQRAGQGAPASGAASRPAVPALAPAQPAPAAAPMAPMAPLKPLAPAAAPAETPEPAAPVRTLRGVEGVRLGD